LRQFIFKVLGRYRKVYYSLRFWNSCVVLILKVFTCVNSLKTAAEAGLQGLSEIWLDES
jgi:hypothetical protein